MFGILNRRKRAQTLRSWRQRRIETGLEHELLDSTLAEDLPAAGRVRARHRAPTPKWGNGLASLSFAVRARPTYLSWIVSLATLIGVVLHLGLSGRYRINGALVSGNARVPAGVIYQASGLAGQNAFRMDRRAAVARLEALPEVKHAEIGVALPARLWIKVVETAPVLLWQGPAGNLLVDERGRVIAVSGQGAMAAQGAMPGKGTTTSEGASSPQGLVTVRDASGFGLVKVPGDRLPDGVVASALALATRFSHLSYRPDVGMLTATNQGWEVRLGTPLDTRWVARQSATLDALAGRLAAEGAAVDYIDLRPVERPYYRLRGESGS